MVGELRPRFDSARPCSRCALPALAPSDRTRALTGHRLLAFARRAQYSGERYETAEQQVEFERNIFSKTRGNQARSDPDIILLNKQVVVYMFATDVYFYVAGDQNENELILSSVLTAVYETMDAMLRYAAATVRPPARAPPQGGPSATAADEHSPLRCIGDKLTGAPLWRTWRSC